MSSLAYFFRESFIGFKRNLSTAIGSIVTIFLSLLMIGLFVIAGIMIERIVKSVENEVTITCYVADGTEESQINSLKNTIEGNDKVKEVTFTTKDDALEKFRNSMSSSPEIIEQLDGSNPLPASLDVELNNPQDVQGVADEIFNNDTFKQICDNPSNPTDSLKYGQKTVEKLFAVTNAVRIVGVAAIILLIVIALIFINNTIRLAILARRREISIMRLVGASNGFIRGPFFCESILHSAIGAALTIIVLEFMRTFALPNMVKTLAWMPLDLSLGTFLIIYFVLLIAGIIIGLIGSALAMRKYLTI